MKSTKLTDGAEWARQNATHIRDLSRQKIAGSFPSCPSCTSVVITPVDRVILDIVVEDLSKINVPNWKSEILNKLPPSERTNIEIKITSLGN